ncbi:hypothetical protein IMSHALPRED_003807 [Imshaugia aleurites]|uniref:Uncharacterized protein n=1 Tax=Imshaugia aleurites TaxID=172621 RepID=A0A8H3F4H0_9LECA|nr:hypothetical protein IMSHALPRED_003807 [Imshaugia aleurites]
MSGFGNFTGTTTVTTSEQTTNSGGVVGWATGAVIVGTDGVFWGLYLGSRGTRGFCIWPFCSSGKGGSGICIWPFCGGTGSAAIVGGEGGGDGNNGDDGEGENHTYPDQQTEEEKTRPKSIPTSNPTPTSNLPKSSTAITTAITTSSTSTLPKSTTASTTNSTTASDSSCPLFTIPADSLSFDDSPTWNPNDPEYSGVIVSAAYAIWQIDAGSGTEILPPLPTGTGYGYGSAITIGFIPNAGSGRNSTNGSSLSTSMMSTSMPGVVNSAIVATSAASMASDMSNPSTIVAPVQRGQRVESQGSMTLIQAPTSAQSVVATVENVFATNSEVVAGIRASMNNHASAQSVASVQSVLSAASVASAAHPASSSASIASIPLPTPNLAILILRNDYCDDTTCGSTGYVYDVVPAVPSVSACANPPSVDSFSYTEDVANEEQNYEISTGKFTSHGVYTDCEYFGSSDFFGTFSCAQVDGVLCSLPTEPEASCTDANSIYADDWVPIAYCEWVGTVPTRTTSAAAARTTAPVTCQIQIEYGVKGIVLERRCKCSDGSSPTPYISGNEWTCPHEVAS